MIATINIRTAFHTFLTMKTSTTSRLFLILTMFEKWNKPLIKNTQTMIAIRLCVIQAAEVIQNNSSKRRHLLTKRNNFIK
nr:MAG TPA: hypothetical protein [Caudoviricetes sp.]